MRPRFGKFTRAVIALGVVAGILLALRPLLPKQMRYEIDDFFRRPFIPHFIIPVHALKPVPEKQVVDELNAWGFDVRCYGNLAPSEKITSKDDFHCGTTLKSAFDHIPARDLRLWFQNGALVHVRFEFPSGELARIHAYLNRVLDPKMAQHLKPGSKLGVDNIGYPIMSWYTPDGSITVNSQDMPNERNTVLWSSWVANAAALDATDTGTYTVVQRTGGLTDLAFCNVAARLAPERKAHLLITLLTPVPTPIPIKKVSAERSFPALDAAPPPALPSPMSIKRT